MKIIYSNKFNKYYFPLIVIITIFIWFNYFTITSPYDITNIIIEGLYLLFASIILYFIGKLDICALNIGWSFFTFALLINFIDEFTEEPDIFNVFIKDLFMSIGLIAFTLGVYLFISRYKEIIKEIKNKIRDYETIFNNTQDAIFLIDVIDNYILKYNRLNPTHEKLTGLSTEMVKGKTPRETLGKKLGKEVEAKYIECINNRTTISFEETLHFPTGENIWHTKLTPVFNENNEIIQIVGLARDITKRKQMEQSLKHLSFHDQLTGLYNRRYFENEVNRLGKSRKLPISIIVADLNGLKALNDNYGH